MALPYKALIYKFLGRPADVSAKVISSDLTYLKDDDIQKLRQLGVVMQDLSEFMYKHTLINYERSHIYRDVERSMLHPIMASAMELYADSCSNYSKLHNKTVWITSENAEYRNQLDDLLEKVGVEERIFDWAWSVGQYGDLFVKVKARPGVGIISVDDDDHPINMSRVDVDGRLVGFFKTPLGELQGGASTEKILPPWEYAHFRLLGVKKKRTMYNDPMMSEYKTLSIVTPEVRQISSKYGTSLLLNALPAYKRLRMAEDALLMSRLSKSMLKYIYKVKVDGCLRGDTHIRLLDGTSPTIKEMSDNSEKYIGKGIWTVNSTTKKLEVGRVLGIPQTRKNAEMVRVHLDNSSWVDATPDHKFMLRDGTFCEAKDLQPGTSLMPHYEKKSEKVLQGYNLVYDPSDSKYHYEHRHVAKDIIGRVVERGLVIHHKDFKKEDNDPANLDLVTQSKHISLHHKGERFGWSLLKGRPQSKDHVARRMQAKAGYKHSDETKQKISEAKIGKPIGPRASIDEVTRAKISTTVRAQYASGRLANRHNVGVHLVARELRQCACGCGHEQTVLATDPWRYKLGHQPKESMRKAAAEWHRTHPVWNKGIKNHKVVSVAPLNVREDVYDLQVDINHNFPIGAGIFVHNSNLEAVGALLDEYKTVLKRARAMDLSKTSPYFADKLQDMVNSEDVILPVWGDVGNVEIEKLGGEADIHWITDIEELRNQLAIALRCPLQLLGGYIDEVPGSLGKSSVENLDIRFARSARRLQRSTLEGIKRMCQIHLAYKGMSPDPHLFDVNMAEISTAEEQELKNALDTGVDVVDKLMELIQKYAGNNVDMMEILDYLNQRILKLNDINFNELKIKMQKKGVIDLRVEPGAPVQPKEEPEEAPKERRHIRNGTTDLMADTVLNEAKWNMRWGGKTVTVKSETSKET